MVWDRNKTGSNTPQWVKDAVNDRQRDMCACIDKTVCVGTIDEYDHIINVKATGKQRRDLERDPDLFQGLCQPCHRVKIQREAAFGRQRRAGKRKPRPHPSDVMFER